jgi:hypothetical protein
VLTATPTEYFITGSLWRLELGIVGLWFVAIVVHELGHAVGAALRGFRVITMYAGPLFVSHTERGGVRLGVRRALFGGAVLAVPRRWDGDQRLRRDYGWFVAAGPAASLLTGSIALAVALWRPQFWGELLLLVFSAISLTIGILTLVPTRRASGRTSDGQKLFDLRQSDPTYAPMLALRLMLHTERPRDWDPVLLAALRPESEHQGPDAIDATILLYFHALDSGDTAAAQALLQRAIDYTCGTARWPRGTISMEIGVEAAFFEAVWRRDAASARTWLDRAPFSGRRATKLRGLFSEAFAGAPKAIEKVRRMFYRSPQPGAWLTRAATLERLNSSGSG